MLAYAAFTLFVPGTILDRAWVLNPEAYVRLSRLGRMMAVPFVVTAVLMVAAAIGWLRRKYWGWMLGVFIIAMNILGDVMNAIRGEWVKGGVGFVIAGILLIFMTRPRLRNYFVS